MDASNSYNLIGGMNLNEQGQKIRHKLLMKLEKAENRLESIKKQHENSPTYNMKRADYSVHSFQSRIDALDIEMEEAIQKVKRQFEDRRLNLLARLEESKRRVEIEKNSKHRDVIQWEREVLLIIKEMESNGVVSLKEKKRLAELEGSPLPEEPPLAPPPVVSPPAPEPSGPSRLHVPSAQEKKAVDSFPMTLEELELKKLREQAKRDVLTKEREQKEKEEEAKEKALKLYEAEMRKTSKPKQVEEVKEQEEESDSDAESSITETTPEEEEEHRQQMLAKYKKPMFYTPPPPPVQEMPRVIQNTKAKKPIKGAKY